MSNHTTRLLEALKEEHRAMCDEYGDDMDEHRDINPDCETCQLIAEVEAELKGEQNDN